MDAFPELNVYEENDGHEVLEGAVVVLSAHEGPQVPGGEGDTGGGRRFIVGNCDLCESLRVPEITDDLCDGTLSLFGKR